MPVIQLLLMNLSSTWRAQPSIIVLFFMFDYFKINILFHKISSIVLLELRIWNLDLHDPT